MLGTEVAVAVGVGVDVAVGAGVGVSGTGVAVGVGVAVAVGAGVGVSGMGVAVAVGAGVDAGTGVEVAASAMGGSEDVGAAGGCPLSAVPPQATANKKSAAPISVGMMREVVTSSCPLPAWVVGYSPQVAGLPGANRKGARGAALAGVK